VETKPVYVEVTEDGTVKFGEGALESMLEFCTSGLYNIATHGKRESVQDTAKQIEAITCLLIAFSRLSATSILGATPEADEMRMVMQKCGRASHLMMELFNHEPANPSDLH